MEARARLVVIDGSHRQVVAIDKEVVSLGRRVDSDVRLSAFDVSRRHADIVAERGAYVLRDRGSRYGTSVNGEPTSERALIHGDRIQLGRTAEIVFLIGPDDDYDDRPKGSDCARAIIRVAGVPEHERYRVIAGMLAHASVHCPDIDSNLLHLQLRDPDSEPARWLTADFHRIVELDARQGCTADGAFDATAFLAHVASSMVGSFGSTLPADEFHPEDVWQALKDEKRSLFCFMHVSVIPANQLRFVRPFTQEHHRALLCGPHGLDLD